MHLLCRYHPALAASTRQGRGGVSAFVRVPGIMGRRTGSRSAFGGKCLTPSSAPVSAAAFVITAAGSPGANVSPAFGELIRGALQLRHLRRPPGGVLSITTAPYGTLSLLTLSWCKYTAGTRTSASSVARSDSVATSRHVTPIVFSWVDQAMSAPAERSSKWAGRVVHA